MNKKSTVATKTAAKKRGRPAGSKNKLHPDFPVKVDWEELAKKLQKALAAEIIENDSLKEELSRKRNLWERLVCLATGAV